jgi:hypothetical protein
VDTSEHPQLVSNIFLVDSANASSGIRRFDPAAHAFEPVAWPEAMERWRPELERQLRDFNTGVPLDRRGAFADDESLIISPLRNLIGTAGSGGRPDVDHAGLRLHRSFSSTCATCRSRSCRRSRAASSFIRTATATAWRSCR